MLKKSIAFAAMAACLVDSNVQASLKSDDDLNWSRSFILKNHLCVTRVPHNIKIQLFDTILADYDILHLGKGSKIVGTKSNEMEVFQALQTGRYTKDMKLEAKNYSVSVSQDILLTTSMTLAAFRIELTKLGKIVSERGVLAGGWKTI